MPTPFWSDLGTAIQSLSLATEAARLNAARWQARRDEQGVEALLPAHEAAHPKRMWRGLVELHRAIARAARQSGRSPIGWFQISNQEIRREWRVSHDTAARALRDLAECGLIQIRRNARGVAAEYRIVASSVRDVALSQGVQRELFSEAVAANRGQPDATSGRRAETGVESLVAGGVGQPCATHGRAASELGWRGEIFPRADTPPHGADTPPHGADTPPHGADTPPHGAEGCAARFPLEGNLINPSSSSLEKKEEEEGFKNWRLVRARLRSLGVRDAIGACEGAIALGWSAAAVLRLLDQIDSRAIDGVPPWRPGAIFWHLRRSDPGTPLDMPESEEWRRAKAARDQLRRLTAEKAQSRGQPFDRELETLLDGLSTAEVQDLAAEIPPPIGPIVRRRLADWQAGQPLPSIIRATLLQALLRRRSTNQLPNTSLEQTR